MLSQLDRGTNPDRASDVLLIVSELVTNSVLHAEVGVNQELSLELRAFEDRLRIAVTDSGSGVEPRLLPADRAKPGGFGLRVVEELSLSWGVVRDPGGTTCVWCDLPLDGDRAS